MENLSCALLHLFVYTVKREMVKLLTAAAGKQTIKLNFMIEINIKKSINYQTFAETVIL